MNKRIALVDCIRFLANMATVTQRSVETVDRILNSRRFDKLEEESDKEINYES